MFAWLRSTLLFTTEERLKRGDLVESMGVMYRVTKVEPIRIGGFAVFGRRWW